MARVLLMVDALMRMFVLSTDDTSVRVLLKVCACETVGIDDGCHNGESFAVGGRS